MAKAAGKIARVACCRYDLYMDRRQFAEIDGPLFAWEFVLRDESGGASPTSCSVTKLLL